MTAEPKSSFSWSRLESFPIVGILRGFDAQAVREVVRTARSAGLTTLEITMNSSDAARLIEVACEEGNGALNIGAGTVRTLEEYKLARSSGATFIVSPVTDTALIERCRTDGVPVMPGALTPTEIDLAWRAGADVVKVFPANAMGPSYLRDVRAPLGEVRLMPTGGVSLETVAAYKRSGAYAYGVGGPLFQRERIAAGDWPWIAEQIARFREALSGCETDAT